MILYGSFDAQKRTLILIKYNFSWNHRGQKKEPLFFKEGGKNAMGGFKVRLGMNIWPLQ